MDSCCLEAVLFWKLVGIKRVGPDRGSQIWELLWRVPCPWSPPLSVSWWPETMLLSHQLLPPWCSLLHYRPTVVEYTWAETSETVSQSKLPLRLLIPCSLLSVKKPDYSSSFPSLGSLQEPRFHINDFVIFIYLLLIYFWNRCISGWPGNHYICRLHWPWIQLPWPSECRWPKHVTTQSQGF